MRRFLGCLAATVTISILGAPQTANAAAFLWIAGNNFSYSAATCATPGAAFYAWFLAAGAGATTAAYTACAGGFGGSASFAIARAGVGGAGGGFVGGIADPYSGIGVDVSLTDFSDSTNNFSSDASNDTSEFGSAYSINSTGITFGDDSADSELNGLDDITAYLYTGGEDQTTLCNALGGSDCGSQDSTSAGDVTDLGTLSSDLGLTMLGTSNDPSGLAGSTLSFNTTVSDTTQVILVGQGDDVSTPEPASLGLLGAGCVLIGCLRRRMKA